MIDTSKCVNCGLCKKNCEFLTKYNLNLRELSEHPELAYHCFLCGVCTKVCPVDIDGRELVLGMRRELVNEKGIKEVGRKYKGILWEKADYKFANYRNAGSKSAIFPGCNFPSFYPRTTEYITRLFKNEFGIGTVFDCCGKPISETGYEEKEIEIIDRLKRRCNEAGIEELIMLCPNCYNFLSTRMDIRIVTIYEKMRELGVGKKIDSKLRIFAPCPDRNDMQIYKGISYFLEEEPEFVENVQCCGLGGLAAIEEPEISARLTEKLAEGEEVVSVYCASCACNLARKTEARPKHILSQILGIDEEPDKKKSFLNRARTRFVKIKEKSI